MTTRTELLVHKRLSSSRNRLRSTPSCILKSILAACCLSLVAIAISAAQDLPNSKDPAGLKRYEGSELIGYRASKFDEYLLLLGPPTNEEPPAHENSKLVEGQVSYYT